MALLAQFIVLMIHGDIPTTPFYSPEEPGFLLLQLIIREIPMYQIVILLTLVLFIRYELVWQTLTGIMPTVS
jgi:hypothetical protein